MSYCTSRLHNLSLKHAGLKTVPVNSRLKLKQINVGAEIGYAGKSCTRWLGLRCKDRHYRVQNIWNLGHHTKRRFLATRVSISWVFKFFLIYKFDPFSHQTLVIRVALKLYGCSDLQKLTVNKISLIHLYVWSMSVFEKAIIFLTKPFFYYRLQKITFVRISKKINLPDVD